MVPAKVETPAARAWRVADERQRATGEAQALGGSSSSAATRMRAAWRARAFTIAACSVSKASRSAGFGFEACRGHGARTAPLPRGRRRRARQSFSSLKAKHAHQLSGLILEAGVSSPPEPYLGTLRFR